MMNKEKKQNYIKEMSTQFDKSEAVIVAHYQGLTVKQLDDLRKQMRKHGIIFKVTKNRITKLAIEKTKCKDLSNLFTGPTAVALSEDAITSAKILTKFSKDHDNLKILGGIRAGVKEFIYPKENKKDFEQFMEKFSEKPELKNIIFHDVETIHQVIPLVFV